MTQDRKQEIRQAIKYFMAKEKILNSPSHFFLSIWINEVELHYIYQETKQFLYNLKKEELISVLIKTKISMKGLNKLTEPLISFNTPAHSVYRLKDKYSALQKRRR